MILYAILYAKRALLKHGVHLEDKEGDVPDGPLEVSRKAGGDVCMAAQEHCGLSESGRLADPHVLKSALGRKL